MAIRHIVALPLFKIEWTNYFMQRKAYKIGPALESAAIKYNGKRKSLDAFQR